MLVRLGTVFSRIFVAAAIFLILWAVIAFLRTGSWHLVTLAETLAFYHIVVPDFGLPGLRDIYAVLGQGWLAAYLVIFGTLFALTSAKAAPGSTARYLKLIFLSPFTLIGLTIASFFNVVRGIVKYTFIAVMTCVLLTCVWWGLNYFFYAYQFSDSASCSLRQTIFGAVPKFDFDYDCADASGMASNEDKRYYILFMANGTSVEADSGHAWLATAALKKVNNGEFLLTDYVVTGYGPKGPPTGQCYPLLARLYLVIRPIIPLPSNFEAHWCEGGTTRADGPPPTHAPAGTPLPKTADPKAVDAMLGVNPTVVFAVSINQNQYDRANRRIDATAKKPPNYQLLLHDCTTFVRDVAEDVGLYVPPRMLAPYPAESIYSIMKYNMRHNKEAPSS
ncbi:MULTISPECIES: hypothetical protein [unclassified Bradyrhizobium]|uniref:hypothetical protein n=1 Tax=Bradyrhizobium sp. USDA 4541 TaxID=2817704 RepID=UPI0020A426DF|nr:hypothetical protein [Bradyrhizobium sp. USDA 4541]MCP1848386.1 hypothetical protein [Bradyrhizobium sp. USDA 4541]